MPRAAMGAAAGLATTLVLAGFRPGATHEWSRPADNAEPEPARARSAVAEHDAPGPLLTRDDVTAATDWPTVDAPGPQPMPRLPSRVLPGPVEAPVVPAPPAPDKALPVPSKTLPGPPPVEINAGAAGAPAPAGPSA